MLLVVLLPLLPAQGLLPLTGTWRIAGVGCDMQGFCTSLNVPTASVGNTVATFAPNGSVTSTISGNAICGNGTVMPTTVFAGSGTYQVGSDGTLLATDPQIPTAHDLLGMSANGDVFLFSRGQEEPSVAVLNVGVALSSGRSNASLAGTYRFVRMVQNNVAGAYSVRVESGTIAFDGLGSSTETRTLRHTVAINGVGVTVNTSVVSSGTYTVASDGSLTTLPNTTGALSSDGELFVLERHAAPDLEFLVGIRQSPIAAGALDGDWLLASTASEVGAGAIAAGGPFGRTLWGTVKLTSTSASGGTTTQQLSEIVTRQFGSDETWLSVPNVFSCSVPNGTVSLLSTSTSPFSAAVSANGKCQIGLTTSTSGAGVMVALSRCYWPSTYGTATAGTSGIRPILQTYGGFPSVGNSDLGFLLAAALGGTPAILAFATAPANAPILGGTVLIDLAQLLFTSAVITSGPTGIAGVGAGGLPLPLPPILSWAGLHFFVQGFVFDSGTPQGFAMTNGIDLRLCR